MWISREKASEAAARYLRGEKPSYVGIPPKLKAILERGFTAEQINDAYRKVRLKGTNVGTAKV